MLQQPVELLEFVQCLLAKMLRASSPSITPCLINQTGFKQVSYIVEPAKLQQQLESLIQPTLNIAKQSIVIVASIQDDYFQLVVSSDDTTVPVSQCTSPEKVICNQPISRPSTPVSLISDNKQFNHIIDLLIKYSSINLANRNDRTSEQVTLIDARSGLINQARLPKQLTVMTLTLDNINEQNCSNLFWPFFDTDLILLLNEDKNTALSVLIADDSIPSKVATQAMLKKLGCKVTTASDGIEALTIAKQQSFDLILLDERMPGLNGSDVAFKLNQDGQVNYSTPKVALTGITHPEEIDVLFSKGITHYLEKPITKLALENFLQQWQVAPAKTSTL